MKYTFLFCFARTLIGKKSLSDYFFFTSCEFILPSHWGEKIKKRWEDNFKWKILWYLSEDISNLFSVIYQNTHTWHSARNMTGIFGVFVPTSSGWSTKMINKTIYTVHMCILCIHSVPILKLTSDQSDYIDTCGSTIMAMLQLIHSIMEWNKLKFITLHTYDRW